MLFESSPVNHHGRHYAGSRIHYRTPFSLPSDATAGDLRVWWRSPILGVGDAASIGRKCQPLKITKCPRIAGDGENVVFHLWFANGLRAGAGL